MADNFISAVNNPNYLLAFLLGCIFAFLSSLAIMRARKAEAIKTLNEAIWSIFNKKAFHSKKLKDYKDTIQIVSMGVDKLSLANEQSNQKYKLIQSVSDSFGEIIEDNFSVGESADKINHSIIENSDFSIRASAIFHIEEKSSSIQNISIVSPFKERLVSPLTLALERYISSNFTQAHKIHLSIPEGTFISPTNEFNFEMLDIGQQYIAPLVNNHKTYGMIWVGTDIFSGQISNEDKLKIKAIAEKASLMLKAALDKRQSEHSGANERDFLLGISHDLRSPGNSALFALKCFMSDSQNLQTLSKSQKSQLSIIEASIEDQLNIISDVLDLAKSKKGMLVANPTLFNPRSTVEDLCEVYKLQAESKDLNFSLSYETNLSIEFDPRHLKRVLNNILSNAVKYTIEGSIEVIVKSEGDYSIQFLVKDTGRGIPKDQETKLFGKFNRMSNALEEEGSGIGLQASLKLAKLNNSNIEYKPNTPKGSIFTLVARGQKPVLAEVNLHQSSAKKVLFIDDDENIIKTYKRYVKNLDFNKFYAYSLGEAIEITQKERPDIIVSDYNLGEDTANEIFRVAKELKKDTEIIIVSGSSFAKEFANLNQTFETKCIEKPIDRSTLVNILN